MTTDIMSFDVRNRVFLFVVSLKLYSIVVALQPVNSHHINTKGTCKYKRLLCRHENRVKKEFHIIRFDHLAPDLFKSEWYRCFLYPHASQMPLLLTFGNDYLSYTVVGCLLSCSTHLHCYL